MHLRQMFLWRDIKVMDSMDLIVMHRLHVEELYLFFLYYFLLCVPALSRNPQDFVRTVDSFTFQTSTVGVLPCTISTETIAVYWKWGTEHLTAQDLVSIDTFYKNGYKAGPGYDEGLYDIAEDFSLVINDVTVKDSGRFFCEIAVLETGSRLWDDTNVSVFAIPREPFPDINKCSEIGHNCTYNTDFAVINITCSANGYYPTATLSFRVNATKVDPQFYDERTRDDGTKFKSITILASAGEEPYVCEATGLQGTTGRSSTILISQADDSRPGPTMQTTVAPPTGNVMAIILPILIVGIICVVLVILTAAIFKKKSRKNNSYNEIFELQNIPEDCISFIELWKLILLENDYEYLASLRSACMELSTKFVEDVIPEKLFVSFVDWKLKWNENSRKTLLDVLRNHIPGERINALREFTERDEKLTDVDLNFIVSSIHTSSGGLNILRLLDEEMRNIVTRPGEAVDFKQHLTAWRNDARGNQYIPICLALEHAEFRELAQTFFRIPNEYKTEISNEEASLISLPHCLKIGTLLNISSLKSTLINLENNEHLFRTKDMLVKRLNGKTSSKYEARRILRTLAQVFGRNDIKDTMIPSTENKDPVPDTEVFELAYRIFMDDVYPFAKALGCSEEELVQFRIPFDKSDISRGTCGLLMKIVEEKKSKIKIISDVLKNIGYGLPTVPRLFGKKEAEEADQNIQEDQPMLPNIER